MSQANQTQIPAVQTPDDALNQVQQNINKVLRNLNNQIVSNTTAVTQATIIGEIKLASLTLAQFQSMAGTNWVLANGQNVVGSAYSGLTGNTTAPTITVTNATAFLRIN